MACSVYLLLAAAANYAFKIMPPLSAANQLDTFAQKQHHVVLVFEARLVMSLRCGQHPLHANRSSPLTAERCSSGSARLELLVCRFELLAMSEEPSLLHCRTVKCHCRGDGLTVHAIVVQNWVAESSTRTACHECHHLKLLCMAASEKTACVHTGTPLNLPIEEAFGQKSCCHCVYHSHTSGCVIADDTQLPHSAFDVQAVNYVVVRLACAGDCEAFCPIIVR